MSTKPGSPDVDEDADGERLNKAPVTDSVNVEPSILNGMTVTEAQVIALVSFSVCILIGGFVFALTGLWHVLFLLSIFGPMTVLWFSSLYLQTLKRGRPDAYYTQAIHLWLVYRGLAKPKFIRHHGYWDLGRTLDLSLASPLEPAPDPDPPRKPASDLPPSPHS